MKVRGEVNFPRGWHRAKNRIIETELRPQRRRDPFIEPWFYLGASLASPPRKASAGQARVGLLRASLRFGAPLRYALPLRGTFRIPRAPVPPWLAFGQYKPRKFLRQLIVS